MGNCAGNTLNLNEENNHYNLYFKSDGINSKKYQKGIEKFKRLNPGEINYKLYYDLKSDEPKDLLIAACLKNDLEGAKFFMSRGLCVNLDNINKYIKYIKSVEMYKILVDLLFDNPHENKIDNKDLIMNYLLGCKPNLKLFDKTYPEASNNLKLFNQLIDLYEVKLSVEDVTKCFLYVCNYFGNNNVRLFYFKYCSGEKLPQEVYETVICNYAVLGEDYILTNGKCLYNQILKDMKHLSVEIQTLILTKYQNAKLKYDSIHHYNTSSTDHSYVTW